MKTPDKYRVRRRVAALGMTLAGGLALTGTTGCEYDGDNVPAAVSYDTPPPFPTLSAEQKASNDELHKTALAVANGMMNDAARLNAKTPLEPSVTGDGYGVDNLNAIYASNGELVNTRTPLVSFQYHRGQGQVIMRSQDLYFVQGEPNPDVFLGIVMIFNTADGPNSLDAILDQNNALTLQNFQDYMNNAKPELYNGAFQQYIPFQQQIMQAQPDSTYLSTIIYEEPGRPPQTEPATAADISSFGQMLQHIQAQLSQGVS
jgi:hypothetical protein